MFDTRGTYKHRSRGKQLLCFDGFQYGKITPMDIDCTIEFQNRAVVMIEVKLQNTAVPVGERITLERFVNDFTKVGKKAIAIVADHDVFDTSEDVQVTDCLVRELYLGGENVWRPPKKMMTVKALTDAFLGMQ